MSLEGARSECKILLGKCQVKNHMEDLSVDKRIILKCLVGE
jgi:hypothetical protein